MIPHGWTPYHRAEDDELLGYLVEAGDGTVPLTLFGVALGEPGSPEHAEEVLQTRGLSCLAEPWVLRNEGGEEIRVALVAAYPDRVVVVPAPYGYADPAEAPVIVPAEDGPVRLRLLR